MEDLVDATSFAFIPDPDGHTPYYARDKHRVFVCCTTEGPVVLEGADPESFRILEATYVKDAKRVWWNLTPVEAADAATFVTLGSHYAKDRQYVYWIGSVIQGADPMTFTYLGNGEAADANHRYEVGSMIE